MATSIREGNKLPLGRVGGGGGVGRNKYRCRVVSVLVYAGQEENQELIGVYTLKTNYYYGAP